MPRIPRVIAPHYPHHVVQRGTNQGHVFLDDEDRACFLHLLRESADKTDIKLWAYCLMNNHFHLLLVPQERNALGKCLHGSTFRYAQYFNVKYGRSGRLWQNRYFSCPVDKDGYLWMVTRYIEMNPVRAQLVDNPEDWPWSSARTHISTRHDRVLDRPDWLADEERRRYHRFLKEAVEEQYIRTATSTGRPVGGEAFYITLKQLVGRDLIPKKGGRPKKAQVGGVS